MQPGASRAIVGGSHGPALAVRVSERAVAGKATEAALAALAKALGLRRREVSLVTGTTSRTKIVEIPNEAAGRFADLLSDGENSAPS